MVSGSRPSDSVSGSQVTTNTLAGLESLVRSSSKLAGRKLVFFLSGGFFLDQTLKTRSNAYGASPVRPPAAVW